MDVTQLKEDIRNRNIIICIIINMLTYKTRHMGESGFHTGTFSRGQYNPKSKSGLGLLSLS